MRKGIVMFTAYLTQKMVQLFLSNKEKSSYLMLITSERLDKIKGKAWIIEVDKTLYEISLYLDQSNISNIKAGSGFFEFTIEGKGILKYEEVSPYQILFHGEPVLGKVYRRK